MWVLGIQNQVLLLAWQALDWLSCLHSRSAPQWVVNKYGDPSLSSLNPCKRHVCQCMSVAAVLCGKMGSAQESSPQLAGIQPGIHSENNRDPAPGKVGDGDQQPRLSSDSHSVSWHTQACHSHTVKTNPQSALWVLSWRGCVRPSQDLCMDLNPRQGWGGAQW